MKRSEGGLAHRTITGMVWTAWGKAARVVLQFLILAAMARLLSPTEFGVVSAALVVTGFSTIFSQIGLGPALVQRPELEPRHLDTAFGGSVMFGTLLGAIVWLGAPAAAQFLRIESVQPVLRVLAWIFPVQGIGIAAESLMRRELRFRWLANLEVATYGLGFGIVGIALALAGWGVWALVVGQMTQVVVRSAVLVVARPPNLRHPFEPRAFGELFYLGGGFTLARAADYVAGKGDNMLVGRYLGPEALGFYGRAYSLMSAPAYAYGAVLADVLFPAMAKVQDNPRRLAAAYRRGVAFIALLTLAPSAALILIAPEFIAVALGSRWGAAVLPFQILSIGMLFRTSYKMSDALARGTGAVYRRAWRQILYAALVLAGAWIGKNWGMAGVAWGVLGALTINFILMAELSLEVAGLTWLNFWQIHVPAVRLTVASVPFVWGTAAVLRHWSVPPLGVLSAATCATAASMLLLCWRAPQFFLGADGVWVVDALRTYLPRRRPATGPITAAAGGLVRDSVTAEPAP